MSPHGQISGLAEYIKAYLFPSTGQNFAGKSLTDRADLTLGEFHSNSLVSILHARCCAHSLLTSRRNALSYPPFLLTQTQLNQMTPLRILRRKDQKMLTRKRWRGERVLADQFESTVLLAERRRATVLPTTQYFDGRMRACYDRLLQATAWLVANLGPIDRNRADVDRLIACCIDSGDFSHVIS